MPAFNEEERKVMRVVCERGETHIEDIFRDTGIPVYRLSGILSGLEVKGLVARAGGNRYAAVGIYSDDAESKELLPD